MSANSSPGASAETSQAMTSPSVSCRACLNIEINSVRRPIQVRRIFISELRESPVNDRRWHAEFVPLESCLKLSQCAARADFYQWRLTPKRASLIEKSPGAWEALRSK